MLVEPNYPLQAHNTFGIVAKAFQLVRVQSEADVQAVISRMIAPMVEQSKKANDIQKEPKGSTAFKGPEGVNAVVGMGNNAAMQAMLDQLEEQRKQTALLQQIAASGGELPADFTKPTSAAPSRSAYLRK
jgi:hypothetical protein